MDGTSFLGAGDPGALDTLYRRFLDDPHAVAPDLARGFARLLESGGDPVHARARLVDAWRRWGHLAARLDPLARAAVPRLDELDALSYGLPDREAEPLRRIYAGTIGFEFTHLDDATARAWWAERAERPVPSDAATRLDRLRVLQRTEVFEGFLQQRFATTKRFGSEGVESVLVFIETLFAGAASAPLDEVIAGGMHRGRLAILALAFAKPLPALLREVMGEAPIPAGLDAAADVPYHLGHETTRSIRGRELRLSLSPHPSHLEVVGAVTLGRVHAARRCGRRVLPLLMHTDASFAGQGIVAELFQLAGLDAFAVGGTVHVVVNNQLGFTTEPGEGRTARYCTDIAKLTGVPVLHVNAEDVDAVARAAELALAWRHAFGRDVVVDLVGYRRNGHNEIDEPRFTQPLMVEAIAARPPVAQLYAERLRAEGIDTSGLDGERQSWLEALAAAYASAEAHRPDAPAPRLGWAGVRPTTPGALAAPVATGLAPDRLRALGRAMTTPPPDFALEPKVARFLDQRRATLAAGEGLSWATCEALALASLAAEGFRVRLGGQDTARGAFTQRHLLVHDQRSGRPWNALAGVEVCNSPLSEYAVLAFDYGQTVEDAQALICWEAQFGDFLNLAQAVFDQFIVCGEDRWQLPSGLVMLLPHGLDGGGPDHSTARPERLLAACAGANLQVVNASTPANLFHALRRQLLRPVRVPLAILAPKALLRHRACVSSLDELGPNTSFLPLIDDPLPAAERLVLVSGKLFFELQAERAARGLLDRVALVRLEQLWPLPEAELSRVLRRHPAAELVFAQEEPCNMGAYPLLDRHLERLAGRRLRYAGRPPAATPAAGWKARHEAERQAVIDAALG